jgi:Coenzyme PQQ synthesis protein D (PqqD)
MAHDSEPRRFRPTPDTVAEPLGDDLVLIHMKTDRMFLLARTGARVWDLLSTGYEIAEIQQRMSEEFDATEAQLATDIHDLIASLRAEQLISPDD